MITKSIKDKIKEYFMQNPSQRLRVRQIERKLKLPLPSVIKYCKELKKEGILKIFEIERVKFYTSDRASKIFLLEKKLFNIRLIFNSGLIEHLIKEYSNPAIVLFGSYSKGEDTETSDIDLYLESPKKETIKLNIFEEKLERKVQLFIFNSLSKIQNKELANNIINGITLNGHLEVFK